MEAILLLWILSVISTVCRPTDQAHLTASPSSSQVFPWTSLFLGCEEDHGSTEWTVMRNTTSYTKSECREWGLETGGFSCRISYIVPWDSGVYWCESKEGVTSDIVNITVTEGEVILLSPSLPVMEGNDVSLRCQTRTSPSDLPAEFYRDGSLVWTGPEGRMTIRRVAKSDEGLYGCRIVGRGESPTSRIYVTENPATTLPVVSTGPPRPSPASAVTGTAASTPPPVSTGPPRPSPASAVTGTAASTPPPVSTGPPRPSPASAVTGTAASTPPPVSAATASTPLSLTTAGSATPAGATPRLETARLTVSPDSSQLFKEQFVYLNCETVDSSGEWTVRRNISTETRTECGVWGEPTGSLCKLIYINPLESGVYWCESAEGATSNVVNITVTGGEVILRSPLFPVTEGSDVSLHCQTRSPPSDLPAEFYRDGSLLGTGPAGRMTIRRVSKSDEGLYGCRIGSRGESPTSRIYVAGNPAAAPLYPMRPTVSPNFSQFFSWESVSLSCDESSTGWTLRRNTASETGAACALYRRRGSFCDIRFLSRWDAGIYWCESPEGAISNIINITVTYGDVILRSTVLPVTEGSDVSLHCQTRSPPSDLPAEFYRDGSLVGTGPAGRMTIRRATKFDEGLYGCRIAGRGESPVSWIQVTGNPVTPPSSPVRPTVSPGFSQFLIRESVYLSCDVRDSSTGWTLRRNTTRETGTACQVDWGRGTGSSCTTKYLTKWDAGVYWCESAEGARSDTVNITVTDGDVILRSPVLPVTEGSDVYLHCETKPLPELTAKFYRDGSLIGTGPAGRMTIRRATKSDEGLYGCRITGRGESPTSRIHVAGNAAVRLTVSPGLSLLEDDSVHLRCDGERGGAGWTVMRNTTKRQRIQCGNGWGRPSGSSCNISLAVPWDAGVYWCESPEGATSDIVTVTVTEKPAPKPPVAAASVRLTVSPGPYLAEDDHVHLSCEGVYDSVGWKVMRNTTERSRIQCGIHWGEATGSSCDIGYIAPFESGVYWCESQHGATSNSVTITVTESTENPERLPPRLPPPTPTPTTDSSTSRRNWAIIFPAVFCFIVIVVTLSLHRCRHKGKNDGPIPMTTAAASTYIEVDVPDHCDHVL